MGYEWEILAKDEMQATLDVNQPNKAPQEKFSFNTKESKVAAEKVNLQHQGIKGGGRKSCIDAKVREDLYRIFKYVRQGDY